MRRKKKVIKQKEIKKERKIIITLFLKNYPKLLSKFNYALKI